MFKVGDKVKIIDSDNSLNGEKGEIVSIDNFCYLAEFENKEIFRNFLFDEKSIELIEESKIVKAFKVGDRVEVVNKRYAHFGKKGTVFSIKKNCYTLEFRDGNSLIEKYDFLEKDLKLVKEFKYHIFVAYVYQKGNKNGHGNVTYPCTGKNICNENLEQIIKGLKKEHKFDNVIILNWKFLDNDE